MRKLSSLATSQPIVCSALLSFTATALIGTMVHAQQQGTSGGMPPAEPVARYLPEYNEAGDLLFPNNWEHWVYVGSPLTPNALNNGQAAFPEYHNVYIEPGAYEIYKRTGKFPEGTIFIKILQLV